MLFSISFLPSLRGHFYSQKSKMCHQDPGVIPGSSFLAKVFFFSYPVPPQNTGVNFDPTPLPPAGIQANFISCQLYFQNASYFSYFHMIP